MASSAGLLFGHFVRFHSLKRGETLTYGTRESLTYGVGVSQTDFEGVELSFLWDRRFCSGGKRRRGLEVVGETQGEVFLELEVAEGVVVELLVAVVVESPEGIDFAGDVFVEAEREQVLQL